MENVHRLHKPKQGVPKKFSTLPLINQMIDVVIWYSTLPLLDVFSRYNQMKMVQEDEICATFPIEYKDFYYKMMPLN